MSKMYRYTKTPDWLKKAISLTNTETGVVVEISSSDKEVYSYMLRYYQSLKQQELPYFESQASIGKANGLNERTVLRSIKKLHDIGIIKIKKVRTGSKSVNYYEVLTVDVFTQFITRTTLYEEDPQDWVENLVDKSPQLFNHYDLSQEDLDQLPF